jgi:hypothetical protein
MILDVKCCYCLLRDRIALVRSRKEACRDTDSGNQTAKSAVACLVLCYQVSFCLVAYLRCVYI